MVLAVGENGRMAKASQKTEAAKSAAKSGETKSDTSKSDTKGRPVKTMASFLDGNPALKNTLAQIEKEFGTGSIMPLGSDAQAPIEGISSGSLSVDLALGGKGFPRGRIIEVFGPESSGKTTLALHAIAAAQRRGAVRGGVRGVLHRGARERGAGVRRAARGLAGRRVAGLGAGEVAGHKLAARAQTRVGVGGQRLDRQALQE